MTRSTVAQVSCTAEISERWGRRGGLTGVFLLAFCTTFKRSSDRVLVVNTVLIIHRNQPQNESEYRKENKSISLLVVEVSSRLSQ